jgi:hypothetical protein
MSALGGKADILGPFDNASTFSSSRFVLGASRLHLSLAQVQNRIFLVTFHKRILEWQADHPNITWIGWGIVWAIVLMLFFWPRPLE